MNLAVSDSVNNNSRNKIHPKKFGLYISFASILMMFAGLTSAYLVRQAAGNWLEFKLPNIFFVSTATILASSFTLHLSYRAFLKGNTSAYRNLLMLSFLLGLAFVVLQYQGWLTLQHFGITLDGNPAGSFVYAISGIHAAHVLGGLAAIGVALVHAFALAHRVNPIRKLRFELTLQYWHFVDILWLYLLIFMIIQR